jgi:Domain of unknown function (DUF4328)
VLVRSELFLAHRSPIEQTDASKPLSLHDAWVDTAPVDAGSEAVVGPSSEPMDGFSGRYRSAGRRAQVTAVLLGVVAFFALVSMIHEGSGHAIADDIRAGILREKDLNEFLESSAGLVRIYLVVGAATSIVFLAWLSRTVDNAPTIGAGRPPVTPLWSIAWWFIPLANLVRPYQIVRDLHDRMSIGTSTGGGWIVLAWWMAFLLGNAALAVTHIPRAPTDPDALSTLFDLQQVANALILLGSILGIIVVLRIQWRSEDRADSLGVHRSRRRLIGSR